MDPKSYTDDAICAAMGLGQFRPIHDEFILRVLFKPSFHPEACLTLTQTHLHVVALKAMLWHEPIPCRMSELATLLPLDRDEFDSLVRNFDQAFSLPIQNGNLISIDGMPVSILRFESDEIISFNGQLVELTHREFIINLLRMVLTRIENVSLRNRISQCGQYLDRCFTTEPEPPAPDVTRIMVLGSPEDRADYLECLRLAAKPPQSLRNDLKNGKADTARD